MTLAYMPQSLPIRIDPIEDEAFSSWLGRVASFYSIDMRDLLSEAGMKSADAYELDLHVSDKLLKDLSRITGVSLHTLKQLPLRNRYPALDKRWLRYAVDHNPHCRQCLSEMEKEYGFEYIKADWRLWFVTTCPIHVTFLATGICSRCWEHMSIGYRDICKTWTMACNRPGHKRAPAHNASGPQHVVLWFVIGLEESIKAALKTDTTGCLPFQGSSAGSFLSALLDLVALNYMGLNIFDGSEAMFAQYPTRYSLGFQDDLWRMFDLLQMTLNLETLLYIRGDISKPNERSFCVDASLHG
jgi:hypothetical protein